MSLEKLTDELKVRSSISNKTNQSRPDGVSSYLGTLFKSFAALTIIRGFTYDCAGGSRVNLNHQIPSTLKGTPPIVLLL